MDTRKFELSKQSYQRWCQQQRDDPNAKIQWIPAATSKWWHVGKDPGYYLIEAYKAIDDLSMQLEQCNEKINDLEEKLEEAVYFQNETIEALLQRSLWKRIVKAIKALHRYLTSLINKGQEQNNG